MGGRYVPAIARANDSPGCKGNAEGAAVLDAHAFQYGGQRVENMQRTPH
jgi:hypothetical protein